jgi:hypothetical protein
MGKMKQATERGRLVGYGVGWGYCGGVTMVSLKPSLPNRKTC